MDCECNKINCGGGGQVKQPRIKHIQGNVLRIAIPLTLRSLVKDGDEMIATDTDFVPSSEYPVIVVLSKGKTVYPLTATMDGNLAIIEDNGKIPVGTYDITVECRDEIGKPYRFKQAAVLQVVDATADADIDEEIEYEATTWYLNAAVFLATTEIGSVGEVIEQKLETVFGAVEYDAPNHAIKFFNKDRSEVLGTLDSRPFTSDGAVEDVYIDVARQVLVVVNNADAGGRRFTVPLYLIFGNYYNKTEVETRLNNAMLYTSEEINDKIPLIVPVTSSGGTLHSTVDVSAILNAIVEDNREVIVRLAGGTSYYLYDYTDSAVTFWTMYCEAEDEFIFMLITVDEDNNWSYEDIPFTTGGGGGGGYTPPVGGIPKTDLAADVQTSLGKADTALQSFTETDPTVPSWAKQPNKPSYTAQEVGAVPSAGYVATSNDYTDAEKSKLAGIAAGAEVNVQSDWNASSGDAAILNKPTLSTVATSGSYNDLSNKPTIKDVWVTTPSTVDGTFTIHVGDDEYTINLNHEHPQYQPLLTAGTNITIAEDQQTGNLVISAAGGGGGGTQVQADWNQSNSSAVDFIKNKPTIPVVPTNVSSFTNDAGYLTSHQSLAGYAKYVLCADEAAYNAIANKDSGTLYLIPES